jgi:hypothetical protein
MKTSRLMTFAALLFLWTGKSSLADQVVMQNGDSYNGKVLSVTTNVLILQNDNLGTAVLPRAKVAAVGFGTVAAAPPPAPANALPVRQPGASATNAVSDPAALRGIRDQTNLVQLVQSQILGSAGPAAVNKYNEMLDGLSTGKIDLNNLRQQAQSAADQLRSLKQDAGPDAAGDVDAYLAILDNFLQETAPGSAATNSASPPPNAASSPGPAGP